MNTVVLCEIEKQIHGLTREEQLWLIEQMVHRLRNPSRHENIQLEFAAMAADSDIQREIHEINEEFKETEQDGLKDVG